MAYRVLLVGGGSGGHVYPLVAVARALKAQRPDVELLMLGDGIYLERGAKEAGIAYKTIIAPKFRRYMSIENVLDIFKAPFALIQSLWRLFWFMPDVVFAKGGYTCALPTLAARFYGIPVYLHESDSVPGLTNRALAKRSKLVFTAFDMADQYFAKLGRPTMQVGNPINTSLSGVDHAAALKALGLSAEKKTIFIIGGSQGAQQLNDLVINGLVQMVEKGWNIIHQTGDNNFAAVKKSAEQDIAEGKEGYAALIGAQYRVYPFLGASELATAYAAADVVVTRAGAGSLAEISYLGKPCVVVPLPGSAGDHQLYNAIELAKYGAIVADSANVTPQLLISQIERLLEPATYTEVSQKIRSFAKPDAAQRIAAVLLGGH